MDFMDDINLVFDQIDTVKKLCFFKSSSLRCYQQWDN